MHGKNSTPTSEHEIIERAVNGRGRILASAIGFGPNKYLGVVMVDLGEPEKTVVWSVNVAFQGTFRGSFFSDDQIDRAWDEFQRRVEWLWDLRPYERDRAVGKSFTPESSWTCNC